MGIDKSFTAEIISGEKNCVIKVELVIKKTDTALNI